MEEKHGNLSINSDNIFPIIKKWLYSDQDIFYRELVSNACDAVTKLKKLNMMGEYELPDGYKPEVDIKLNPDKKTIKVIDNGLGMTEDEVEQYINQIAFSGATDFFKKYKDKTNEDQIIGHFGLGFYSAFMIAESVDIDTLSYRKDAKPVHWTCDGGDKFDMADGDKKDVGTVITLHVNEDCLEYCNEYKASEVIKKYCAFMPTEIWMSVEDTKETQTVNETEKKADDIILEEIKPEKDGDPVKYKIVKRPQLMNDINPLWAKTPSECTDEEYKAFYRKVFNDYKEPLFWIHLNMDYPFNMKGILYFPKINIEYESIEGKIKLYNNQVFVADNIKEVIPEFLMLLKGVIDCPDLPLNVSRSALQNDGFVKKIQEYITKKVADKLSGMCKTDKENYDKYWNDISPFIKYGCLKDEKFCEKMRDYILFENLDGKYLTLPEALEVNKADTEENATDENGNKVEAEVVDDGKGENAETDEADKNAEKTDNAADDKSVTSEESKKAEEKKEKTIYYVTDKKQQGQYINMFRSAKMDAVILDQNIDQPFISQLEAKNEGIKFMRIDADINESMRTKISQKADKEFAAQAEEISKVMKKYIKKDNVTIKVEKLKNRKVASMVTLSEETRRMQDMMKMYSMQGLDMGPQGKEGMTLILNAGHPLVQYIMNHKDGNNTEMICEQLYDLGMLQQAPLDPDEMTRFIARSNDIMMMLAGDSDKTAEGAEKEDTEEKTE